MTDTLEISAYRTFTDLYAALWDLYTGREAVRKAMVDLNEEFREKVPRTKLVLYLKRKYATLQYSALYWGHTIPGVRAWSGEQKKKRLKHLPGPLNDSVIHFWGIDSRRKQYYDFERRRLAVNTAYHTLTAAIVRTRKLLIARYGKGSDPSLPAPLPPPELFGDLTAQGEECARLGWKLVFALLDVERSLETLAGECAALNAGVQLVSVRGEGASSFGESGWRLTSQGEPQPKLTYAVLRALPVEQDVRQTLRDIERRRRQILKVRRRHASAFEAMVPSAVNVAREARGALAEARLARVDEFGHSRLAGDGGVRGRSAC